MRVSGKWKSDSYNPRAAEPYKCVHQATKEPAGLSGSPAGFAVHPAMESGGLHFPSQAGFSREAAYIKYDIQFRKLQNVLLHIGKGELAWRLLSLTFVNCKYSKTDSN